MKRYFLCFCILFSLPLWAQDYYVPPGYEGCYDYDHRVIVRSDVYCTDDYQDLWNGCYVRLNGNYVYVYNSNGNRILYGTDVVLFHTGQYAVSYNDGDTWRLVDSDGDYLGAWGDKIVSFWNGMYSVRNGDIRKLYDSAGNYTGLWGYGIGVFWNGYYWYNTGSAIKVAAPDGDYIGVWGDDVDLMDSGNFRAERGGYYYLYDTAGNRVY